MYTETDFFTKPGKVIVLNEKKRCLSLLLLCCAVLAGAFMLQCATAQQLAAQSTPLAPQYQRRILLIPLDSRPPCVQFVQNLAELAGFTVVVPPEELLAQNKTLADKNALRGWLQEQAATADAAIVSIDTLVHGGLVPSRQGLGRLDEGQSVIELLQEIKRQQPGLKLYAFNIIPRLLIADNAETIAFQRDMMQYSVAAEQTKLFDNDYDQDRKTQLVNKLPPELLKKYLRLYEENQMINKQLLDLAEAQVLSGLVIGQDDGYPFGIANEEKQELIQLRARRPALADKVVVTRGTDEVALTMLGFLCSREFDSRPRVCVIYSDDAVRHMTMPFMPNSIQTTVAEKLRIAGAVEVSERSEADYILFVHAGFATFPSYEQAADRLVALLQQQTPVAVVDLSENFKLQETLLPMLQRRQAPLERLIAYAGWNTTSNSVGTAVTEAGLYIFRRNLQPDNRWLQQRNQEFVLARMLDDTYYQKQENPQLNKRLRQKQIDVSNLTPADAAALGRYLENRLRRQARPLLQLWQAHTELADAELQLTIPWRRTFEIKLDVLGKWQETH